ncbi:hypothetical protein IJ531_02910 [bacterium]|nr:hypothetical protein [bacterium]
MKNLKTNDELIKELLTQDEQKELYEEVQAQVKQHGGARIGAGRKKKDPDNVLKFQVRVSKKEKTFLEYARSHNLNYDELMQG